MNSNFQLLLLIFLLAFIITTSPSSARKLAYEKGGVDKKINYTNNKESNAKSANIDSFEKLMGLEECGNGDGECLMRRAVEEVHLDYIYTQKRVP